MFTYHKRVALTPFPFLPDNPFHYTSNNETHKSSVLSEENV